MAKQTVRELLTKWGFEVDTKPIDQFNKSLKDAKTTVTLIGAQAIAQAGALFGLANAVATTGDHFAKTAARIGIGVETLQEYGHVANLAGASTQEMTSALEGVTLAISEAKKGGGKLIEPLIRLNQLTGKDLLTNLGSADDFVLQLSDAFAEMTDRTEKAELANKIFGGSGLAMVNVLNQGSAAIMAQRNEAKALGIVLGEGAARQSEVFKDTLLRLQSTFIGLRNIIGVEIMPTVTEFMNQMKQFVLVNREAISTELIKFMRALVDWTRKTIVVMERMYKILAAVVRSFGGLEHVIKVATFALLTFTAAKFLSAIGHLSVAIGSGLVMAFRGVGNAALLAQAKMLAMPILVGLAVAGLFLVFDDLLAYFQGRDSITGRILSSFEGMDLLQIVKDKINAMAEWLSSATQRINTAIAGFFDPEAITKMVQQGVEGAFTSIAGFFDGLTLDNFGEKITELLMSTLTGDNLFGALLNLWVRVFEAIVGTALTLIGGLIKAAVSAIKGGVKGALNFSGEDGLLTKAAGFFGLNSDGDRDNAVNNVKSLKGSTAGILQKYGVKTTQTTVRNENNITVPVNVPPGTSPQDGVRMVQEGVKSALDQMARETQAATQTNVER